MNKEDYVSLEVAKLLKEKGYCWPCNSFYTLEGLIKFRTIADNFNRLTAYSRPALYEAQKWLIGKDIYVSVDVYGDGQWMPTLCEFGREKYNFIPLDVSREKTYEEALNAGILEALKLI